MWRVVLIVEQTWLSLIDKIWSWRQPLCWTWWNQHIGDQDRARLWGVVTVPDYSHSCGFWQGKQLHKDPNQGKNWLNGLSSSA